MAMDPRNAVKELLRSIESETGKRIPYVVGIVPTGIGDVQVTVYPSVGDAEFRIFNLHDDLTPMMRRAIREWFEPFFLGR
jgi:hypothetical protein